MPNYSLTKNLEDFVAEKVAAGDYNNASEVVREALRLLQHRELRLAAPDAVLARAKAEAERGEVIRRRIRASPRGTAHRA